MITVYKDKGYAVLADKTKVLLGKKEIGFINYLNELKDGVICNDYDKLSKIIAEKEFITPNLSRIYISKIRAKIGKKSIIIIRGKGCYLNKKLVHIKYEPIEFINHLVINFGVKVPIEIEDELFKIYMQFQKE